MSSLGLIGLSTMGINLARNISRNKISISVFNRTNDKTEEFIQKFGNDYTKGEMDIKSFIKNLEKPRKILILVKAGKPVEDLIESLIPLLEKDDIIIDCGNSNFKDSILINKNLSKKQIKFMDCGISGGEEGALKGPSIMAGGNEEIYNQFKNIFETISAKDFEGRKCVAYMGGIGSGHYTKMIHNGIEYGIMQMMAEAYDLLKTMFNLNAPQIAEIFSKFNNGRLKSYLMEISLPILNKKEGEKYLIDKILDKAGQKGTGKWTSLEGLDRDIAIPTLIEAVFARVISGDKEKRQELAKLYENKIDNQNIKEEEFVKLIENALYFGFIFNYIQGFNLISKAAKEENWSLDLKEIARIWQGGCIIRADILKIFYSIYKRSTWGTTLLAEPEIKNILQESLPNLKKFATVVCASGVPAPTIINSLFYFENYIKENSPANFIQGLRDYFGAHTYERIDQKGIFHTKWNE